MEFQDRMVQGRTQVEVHRKAPDPVPAGRDVQLECVLALNA